MSESIAASENKISDLSARVGVSPAGKAWLRANLDPFADLPIVPEGFPDLNNTPSVVRTWKSSITIGAPASVAPGANWQACIYLDPLVGNYVMKDTIIPAPFTVQATGQVSALNCGGLTIRSGPEGGVLTMADTTANLPLPAIYANAKSRVLGMAMELHNTTAEIYKQGSILVFRKASEHHRDQALNTFVNPLVLTQRGAALSLDMPGPPTSRGSALILPGSKEWNAADGCMCVSTMCSQTNDAIGSRYFTVFEADSKLAAGHGQYSTLFIDAANNSIHGDQNTLATPYNYSGAFLTGLSNQTTILADVIMIVETFPDEGDSEIITMATPSPPCDFPALEIYSRLAHVLPPGVPANWNADGDWIKNLANLLGTVGVPGMPLVNMGVDAYNTFMKQPAKDPVGLLNLSNAPWIQNAGSRKPVKLNNNNQQQRAQQPRSAGQQIADPNSKRSKRRQAAIRAASAKK